LTGAPSDPPSLQAVILAGGQGTRLRPLTLTRAKPVVPLLNRPFLAYQLALLQSHGVRDVILSCSYRVEDIRGALGDPRDVQLRYVIEKEPLGTGGGVRNAADLTRGSVFVLNGDVLTDADLTAMRGFHAARGARVTILLKRVEDPRQYGLCETATDGRLLGFREKPIRPEDITTDQINAGVYLIEAELLRRMPADRPVSIEREFFPALIDDGIPCFGWCPPMYWRDIGSPAAYHAAQMDLLAGEVKTTLPAPDAAGRVVEAGRVARDGGRLVGPAVVGAGVDVATDSVVGPYAVVGDGSTIGSGARVERAVLWERVTVGRGATLRDCVIGNDARIGEGAEIGAGAVIEPGAVVPGRARPPA
jgi:NDP-sugar pyrophosphorylase family protein